MQGVASCIYFEHNNRFNEESLQEIYSNYAYEVTRYNRNVYGVEERIYMLLRNNLKFFKVANIVFHTHVIFFIMSRKR